MKNKFPEFFKKNSKKIVLSFLSILLIGFLIIKVNSLYRLNKIEKQTFGQMPQEKQEEYLQLQDSLVLLKPEDDYVEGEVIAKFNEHYLDLDKSFSLDNLRKDLLLKNIDLELDEQYEKSNQVVLKSETKTSKEIIDEIYFYPYFEYVELNRVLKIVPMGVPIDGCYTKETMNETDFAKKKAIPYSRYEEYWNSLIPNYGEFKGKNVVKIGVVDSSVEKNTKRKPSLGDANPFAQSSLFFENLSSEHFANKTGNMISKENLPFDDYANHGTSVAGVIEEISQRHNNKLEIVSLFHEDHNTDSASLISALKNAEDAGVKIFNLSFVLKKEVTDSNNFFKSLSEYIRNSDSLFIWALSNDDEDYGNDSEYYSECLKNKEISNLICVGSEGINGNKASFSSYTTNLEQNKNFIYAPGEEMYLPVAGYYCPEGRSNDDLCTYLQQKYFGRVDENTAKENEVKERQKNYPATYCRRSGNSFAAPYVAGLAGLVMSESGLDAGGTKALIFNNSNTALAQSKEDLFNFGSLNNEIVEKKKLDFQAVLEAAKNTNEVKEIEKEIEEEKKEEEKAVEEEPKINITFSDTPTQTINENNNLIENPSGTGTHTEQTSDTTNTNTNISLVEAEPIEIEGLGSGAGSLIGQSCGEDGGTYWRNEINKCDSDGMKVLICDNKTKTWKIEEYCGADQICWTELRNWAFSVQQDMACKPRNACSYAGDEVCDTSYTMKDGKTIPSNKKFVCENKDGNLKWKIFQEDRKNDKCGDGKVCQTIEHEKASSYVKWSAKCWDNQKELSQDHIY